MKNPEVIYFEGLPRTGKTTLTTQIASLYPHLFISIAEIVHPGQNIATNWDSQFFFMENDEMKYKMARESGKRCLVDRGHLSTVLYSHAYDKLVGDRDLTYVNQWYFGKILKHNMLPDLYVLLDAPPEVSLQRKIDSFDMQNMWDHVEGLEYARENYPRYMGMFEPSVRVLTLSSASMTLDQLKNELVGFLGIPRMNYYLGGI